VTEMDKKQTAHIKTLLLILLLLLPFFLTIPTIVFLLDNTLVLFPNPEYSNQLETYTSQNSSIENFQIDSKSITFSYILRNEPAGLPWPYSSIVIWLTRENTFFDLSGYDYLILDIEKATAGHVVIFIKTFENGISNPDKNEALTLRHNEYTLLFTKGVSRYKIEIKNFLTQDWWFSLMHIPWNKRTKETYKKVSALDLQFINRSATPPEEKMETFIINKITFHKSYPVLYIILNIVTVIYCLFLVMGIFMKRKSILQLTKMDNTPSIKEIQYRQLELENYAETEITRIMKYLEEHYHDPKISSTLISGETGIPRTHIADLIKSKYNCSCKQLINKIRITEAKRLLKTTDWRILEIALEVGFNDISTFNRCFKQLERMSPRQYRRSAE